MKKNWEIFINHGLVVYLRVCALVRMPLQPKIVALFVFCMVFGVFFSGHIFSLLFGGTAPGVISRSLAGDFSFVSGNEKPRVEESVFRNFSMGFDTLKNASLQNENAQYWSRTELENHFKTVFPIQKDLPPVPGIACASQGGLMDLIASDKLESQKWIGCKQMDDVYYYAGLLNHSTSNNKDIRYFFYAVRKQPTLETRDHYFGKEYQWATYALNVPNSAVYFYKSNSVPSVQVADVAYTIQKSFPEGFKVEK